MNLIKAFIISLLLFLNFQLTAQVRNYTFQDTITGFNPISGGTQHGSATVDDASYSGLSIGFSFLFNGQTYTKISINSNGYIAFGSSIVETYNPISDPDGTANIVSALTYDLKGQSNGELRSQSIGTAPNRVFVVQWLNFKRYGFNGDSLDFQIRLSESTNKIDIVYGRCELAGYTNSIDNLFEVGLRGYSNTDFSNRKIGNSDNWSNSKNGTNNSDRCRITSSISPPPGLSYSWEKIIYQHDVSIDQIITTSGCGASSSEDISIRIKNNGIQTQNTVIVGYQINGANAVIDTCTQSIASNSSILFSFSQKADFSSYGNFEITAWSSLATDTFYANDTLFAHTLFSTPSIDSFPYFTNFENNASYWHSGIITSTNPWEWGAPAQTKINSAYSGSKSWMTYLGSNYPDNCQSYLQSPCFNFSGFASPSLSFYMRLETENKWDPMVVEASTDQGQTWKRVDSSNTNFYNATNTGGPFAPPYFSGSNSSWTKYTASLSDFGNETSVKIRYRFLADGSSNDEGIAIDDIKIFAQTDIALIGLFLPADSTCGDSMQDVYIIAKNIGAGKTYNIPFRVQISGPLTKTISKSVNILNANQIDTLWIGSFNSTVGGQFQFKCFSRFGSDDRRGNDTIWASRYIYPTVPQGGKIIPYFINHKTIFNAGTAADPDISCHSDTSSYTFQLPTGLSWNDYGTAWTISDAKIETEFGQWPIMKYISDPAQTHQMLFLLITTSYDTDSLFRISLSLNLSNGCSREYEHYLKVGEDISPEFSVNNTCMGTSSHFANLSTVSSGNLNYHWDFGNGDTSVTANPVYSYAIADSYNVKLIATATSGCTNDYNAQAIVHESPSVSFNLNDMCVNDTAWFINQTPSLFDTINFYWDFGNGLFSTSYNGFSFYDSGQYWITLKALTNHACSDSISKLLTVYPLPIIDFTTHEICLGDTVFMTNSSIDPWGNALTYHWHFNKTDTSTLKEPYFIPTTFGNFDIRLSAFSDKLCSKYLVKYVNVNAIPQADFNYLMPQLCLGDTLKINNNSSIASSDTLNFRWEYGLQDTSTVYSPIVVPDTMGSFSMQLVVQSNKQCADTISKQIQVYEKPYANFTIDNKTICFGDTLKFSNSSFISSGDTLHYVWLFDGIDTSSKENPNYKPTVDGSIDILLTSISSFGCWDTTKQTAIVYELPDASFTNTIQTHGLVDFMPNDTNLLSYLWFFGDGDSSTIKLASHTYKIDQEYKVNLIVSSIESCINEDSSFIIITGAGIVNSTYLDNFNVYPNPFKQSVEIEFTLTQPSELNFQLYDLHGKMVFNGKSKLYPSGANKEKLAVDKLASGNYFIRIVNAENQVVMKMITKTK